MKKHITLAMTGLLTASGAVHANSIENAGSTSKQISKVKAKTASADMNIILNKLESDYEFIGKFLDNPEAVISKFKLNPSEKLALTTRDIHQLMNLGLSEEEVTIAMSGAHRGRYRN